MAAQPGPNQPVVMMVEDDLAIAAMYQIGLEEAGYYVVVLSDADALFETLDRLIPDMLVLDWQLEGGITGGDILRLVRNDGRTRDVPILFMSNSESADVYYSDPLLRREAISWLVKSNTPPAALAMHVRAALRRFGHEQPNSA